SHRLFLLSGSLSGAEVLGELQTLRLIVRADALTIQHLRPFDHALIDEAPDDLAVLEDEGDLVAADFKHRSAAGSAGRGMAEAGIEKAGVVDAELADQRVERHHLGGI